MPIKELVLIFVPYLSFSAGKEHFKAQYRAIQKTFCFVLFYKRTLMKMKTFRLKYFILNKRNNTMV